MNSRFIMIFTILFIIVIISEYIAYASLNYYEIIKSKNLEIILMVLSIILPLAFVVSMIYSYKHYSVLNSWINAISSVWIGLIIYILIASLIVFILIMLNTHLDIKIPIKFISELLVAIVCIIITYGIINASNPRIERWSIESSKLSSDWNNKKIIMISDVHLGQIRDVKFFQKILEKINKENPDIVFILGDLIDGPSFPYQKWLGQLSIINPKMGIIYIEGNHEKYSQEYEKFKSEIPSYVNNLTDKKVIINNTQIIGLDYNQNETPNDIKIKLKSLGYDESKSSIVLIHDPKNNEALADENVSLVLSGHTHGGQLFPFTVLVKSLYKNYTHGITETKNTTSITSYGVGTSIIPMRIGTIPEIIVLTIK